VSRQNGSCEVEFRCFQPDAEEVYLVSDFNGWDPCSLPMTRASSGSWVCRMKLHRGIHQLTPLVILASGEWSVERTAFVLHHHPRTGRKAVSWSNAATSAQAT
jgi:1,4-alpha-glucan branching enzyme